MTPPAVTTFPPNATGAAALELLAKLKTIPSAGVNPITQDMQNAKGSVKCTDGSYYPYFWVNPVLDPTNFYQYTGADSGQFVEGVNPVQALAFGILASGGDNFSADVHPTTQEQSDEPLKTSPLTPAPTKYTALVDAGTPIPNAGAAVPTPAVPSTGAPQIAAPTPAAAPIIPTSSPTPITLSATAGQPVPAGHVSVPQSALARLAMHVRNVEKGLQSDAKVIAADIKKFFGHLF